MGCTKHSLYRHGGKRSGMVCVQRRRSRTRSSGQIRTVRRAHLRVRVLTARQTNSVRALQTAGRDAAEGLGDSVAARLRQPSGTPQPTGGPETPNRTPKAPDSPRLDVSCRARARGTDGFAGETAVIFQLGVFFEEPMLDPKKAPPRGTPGEFSDLRKVAAERLSLIMCVCMCTLRPSDVAAVGDTLADVWCS